MTRRTDDPAEALADELFGGSFLGSAKRLVLEMPTDKFDGAGWCKEAVLAAIRRHYPVGYANFPHARPDWKPPKRKRKRK